MKMKKKTVLTAPKIDKQIVICAILCLTIIQLAAFHYGINGVFRAIMAGAICGLAGLVIDPKSVFKKE
jgi:hypothetical protein